MTWFRRDRIGIEPQVVGRYVKKKKKKKNRGGSDEQKEKKKKEKGTQRVKLLLYCIVLYPCYLLYLRTSRGETTESNGRSRAYIHPYCPQRARGYTQTNPNQPNPTQTNPNQTNSMYHLHRVGKVVKWSLPTYLPKVPTYLPAKQVGTHSTSVSYAILSCTVLYCTVYPPAKSQRPFRIPSYLLIYFT